MLADAQPPEAYAHSSVRDLSHVASGVEVRVSYSDDDLLRSQRTADLESGWEIAEAWRQAAIEKGGFKEVKGGV